jgi:hypothetical protein
MNSRRQASSPSNVSSESDGKRGHHGRDGTGRDGTEWLPDCKGNSLWSFLSRRSGMCVCREKMWRWISIRGCAHARTKRTHRDPKCGSPKAWHRQCRRRQSVRPSRPPESLPVRFKREEGQARALRCSLMHFSDLGANKRAGGAADAARTNAEYIMQSTNSKL